MPSSLFLAPFLFIPQAVDWLFPSLGAKTIETLSDIYTSRWRDKTGGEIVHSAFCAQTSEVKSGGSRSFPIHWKPKQSSCLLLTQPWKVYCFVICFYAGNVTRGSTSRVTSHHSWIMSDYNDFSITQYCLLSWNTECLEAQSLDANLQPWKLETGHSFASVSERVFASHSQGIHPNFCWIWSSRILKQNKRAAKETDQIQKWKACTHHTQWYKLP